MVRWPNRPKPTCAPQPFATAPDTRSTILLNAAEDFFDNSDSTSAFAAIDAAIDVAVDPQGEGRRPVYPRAHVDLGRLACRDDPSARRSC